MHTSSLPTRPRRRSGLSIVEVLVALMLVAIGLMGIAGSTALALRTTHDATRRREATELATTRLSQLYAAGCAQASAGSHADSTRHIDEHWWVAARANGLATVTDSLAWTGARGWRTLVLTTGITC